MFDDVRDLYSEAIRSRGRTPRHAAPPPGTSARARADNPMCGDRVEVSVARAPDGTIAQAGFEARGCELSIASADLMCESVAGRSPAEVHRYAAEVEQLAATGDCPLCAADLRPLRPLGAVHEYRSRIRCVTLPWSALLAALDQGGAPATPAAGAPAGGIA